MALTPEDVVNKRFNPTKFREGYDQDEVDDFLDEVVVELRRLNQENEELRQRLVASEARINELQRGGAVGGPAPSAAERVSAEPPAEIAESASDQSEPQSAPVPVEQPTPESAPEAATSETVAAPAPDSPTPVSARSEDHVSDTSSTNNLLQLARRLHEEHVREGIAKRDALIAEGHSTATRVVTEAQNQSREQLAVLESRKAELQTSIDELTAFESEYRAKLKSYIEGQLHELEQGGAVRPEGAEAPTTTPSNGYAVAGASSDAPVGPASLGSGS